MVTLRFRRILVELVMIGVRYQIQDIRYAMNFRIKLWVVKYLKQPCIKKFNDIFTVKEMLPIYNQFSKHHKSILQNQKCTYDNQFYGYHIAFWINKIFDL